MGVVGLNMLVSERGETRGVLGSSLRLEYVSRRIRMDGMDVEGEVPVSGEEQRRYSGVCDVLMDDANDVWVK